MKKRIIHHATLMVLLPVLCGNLLRAQSLSPVIYKSFNSAIVQKVYLKIASVIPISEHSQVMLANAYKRQDSLIVNFIKQGHRIQATKRFIDSTDILVMEDFKKNLPETEKKLYLQQIESKREHPLPVYRGKVYLDAEMDSQFGLAFKLKDKLALTDDQINAIFLKSTELRAKTNYANEHPDEGYFDKPAFESAHISAILSQKQYNVLLATKNLNSAVLKAQYAWHDLRSYKLSDSLYNKLVTDSSVKKMTVFYLMRDHISDRFAHEKAKRDLYLKSVKVPESLRLLSSAKVGSKIKMEKYVF